MFYFETNALRKLAYRLSEESFVKDKYTSILSLIELISGICDNDSFLLRKSIIGKVIQSKILIDLCLPELVRFNAFGVQISNDEISNSIRDILDFITTSDNYSSFQEEIKSNDLAQYLGFIYTYDNNARNKFKESIMNNSTESDTKRLISEFNNRWLPININSNLNTVIQYHASKIKELPNELRTLEQVMVSYDKSIDIYLLVSSYYVDLKVSLKNIPAKNDYFDLSHLIYLKGIDNIIVSDDKMLHKNMKTLFPNNIVETINL